MNEKGPGMIPIPQEDAPQNPDRRRFLKNALRNAVALGVVGAMPVSIDDGKKVPEEFEKIKQDMEREGARESVVGTLTPLDQLEAFGEVKDLQAGVDAVCAEHYAHLVKTGKGKKDMLDAVQNLSTLDMEKVAQPFTERQLPKELSYMIAIQETRGKNLTSKAGARGITGVKPRMAIDLGFKPEDLNDPYKASEITAEYLAQERDDRFGDNTDLLFHAYNAGGGLFGYTKKERRKKDRSTEGFYAYMEDYINTTYKEIEKLGYYAHTVDDEDTNLIKLSERFEVPLVKILEANNLEIDSELHKGDSVAIPFDDMVHASKVVFRKPLQALRYAPQIKAKYRALKDTGLLAKIEK